MALFHFGKKKEETPSCCCGSAPVKAETAYACDSGASATGTESCCGDSGCSIHSIKVLGAGCRRCHEQYENCKAAVEELGMDIEVEYVTDMEKVMAYGVMSMPGIVVNEKVVSVGRVLKASDVIKLFKKSGHC